MTKFQKIYQIIQEIPGGGGYFIHNESLKWHVWEDIAVFRNIRSAWREAIHQLNSGNDVAEEV